MRNHFADAMRNIGDEGVAHAESAVTVGHTVCGPSFGEHLQLIEFVWDKTA